MILSYFVHILSFSFLLIFPSFSSLQTWRAPGDITPVCLVINFFAIFATRFLGENLMDKTKALFARPGTTVRSPRSKAL